MKYESTSTGFGPAGRRLIFLFAVMLVSSASASAQLSSSTTSGTTPLGIAPGAPAGSYALSGFESVNPYNGALNFRLPLLHVGGRGGVGHTIQFVAEQHWRVEKVDTSGVGYVYRPDPNRWSTLDAGFTPGTMVGRRTGLSQENGTEVYCPPDGTALTRFTFTAPDGTEYELRDAQSNGAAMDNVYQPDPGSQFSCQLVATHFRGRVFATSDGTAATFISDLVINDHCDGADPYSGLPAGEQSFASGYLFMRDGTCYRIDGGRVSWIRDRNGNRITFGYDYTDHFRYTMTDSLNRVVIIDNRLHDPVRNQDYDLIAYKGFGGVDRTIKLWYSKLHFALRSDFPPPARTYESLFPALDGSDQPLSVYDPKVVSEIELPDGRKYFLYYNYYGELARVDLPTGGRFEYEYDAGVTGGDPTGVVTGVNSGGSIKNVYRRVTERRVYKDSGATFELKETYSRPESNGGVNQGYVEVQRLAGDGVTILARERHFYFGSAKNSFLKEAYEYPNWKDGKEYQTKFYDKGPVGALLRTVENSWQQPTEGNTWPLTGQGETNDSAKPNQPQVTSVTTTLNDAGQVSKQTFTYDQYTNKTEVDEYDFGNSLVRKTQTTYVVNNLGVNYTTVNPNTTNPDPNSTVHIRSLPSQQSVYDSSSTEKARTTYEYDTYTQGLMNRSNISGHASTLAQPTHTVAYVTRGNVTANTNWDLPSTQRTTRMQYDIAGNVWSVTDPKNNPPTLFDFSDRYGVPDSEARDNSQYKPELGSQVTYAFATLVTNALGHTAYTQYDYYLGKPVNGEDANGVVAKGRYDDALDRGTELVVAENLSSLKRRTLFTYNDAAHLITTNSDQSFFTDGALKSESVYDGLGRTTESRQYETGSAYISTVQNYDGLGRVVQASNPYRPASESQWLTTTTYDGLGRVLTVTTPDNAMVTTTYLGNATTVRDQANKQRRSFTDALGRLTSVDEMLEYPSAGIYATTTYAYDVLDDLTLVTQGGQSRTFLYDSLKRLKQATNPESGAVNYAYDENSNLQTKVDARSITTTYVYDALNRAISRSYTNDPQNTPAVSYKYDSQTLPTGFPAGFNRGVSTGRLVAVTYGGTSAGSYTGYDQLGRVNVSYQQTDSQNYGFGYAYDLASEMTSENYPSGRAITTAYDASGRINSVNGQKTGEANKTYVSQFSYAAHGAVTSMTLGNNLVEKTDFNTRLQRTFIKLGTTSNPTSVLQLSYEYTSTCQTANNGNVLKQTITAPGLSLTQTYCYDSLNRLASANENSGSSWTQTYDYDRYGNRAVRATSYIPTPRQTPTSNSPNDLPLLFNQTNNRIIATGEYGYNDGAGNLTSMPDKISGSDAMTYDAENRQKTFNGTVGQYFYDGDGHRVKKIDSSGTTVFVYNAGGQLIGEYHSDPVPPAAGGGGTSYLTSDHLGSTRVVTKQDGTVKARYDYLPFGEELGSSIGGRAVGMGYSAADSTKQKFTQKERDSESGLDYFLARYYSSAQGRFTSADPIVLSRNRLVDPQQLNLYGYVRNNPLIFIDVTGEEITVVEAQTPDQKKAVESAIATLRDQSNTANQIFALYAGPKDSSSSLNVHVVDDKFFEQFLSDDPGTNKKTTQGCTTPGTVVKDANGNVITADVEIYIRSSAVDKKQEDRDRKDKKETTTEGVLGHEIGHGKDITTDNAGFKQRSEDAKKNQTPYKDRPNEKRADQTLKTIGQERISGKFIKEVRKDLRF